MREVARLQKSFGGVHAAKDAVLDLREGELLSIIGPTGAGKTTVFNLLTGFIAPSTGSVTMDGKRLDGLTPEARCTAGLVRTFKVVQPFRGL